MAGEKIIAICQSGGVFHTSENGVMTYKGGDAHAIDIDDELTFRAFKMEVAEMFSWSTDAMSMKYFLPGNKRTLISISNDKDLMRMLKFHCNCATVDIYVTLEEIVAPDFSTMPASRSSRTTISEAVMQLNASFNSVEVVDPNDMDFIAPMDIITHSDTQIDMLNDISPVLPLAISRDEKLTKAAQQWQNNITGVGQRFNSVTEFREALRKYALANQFAFKYKKNDSHRVTVKCKAEGCPWRIHASRLSTTPLICIKKMTPMHTCEGGVKITGYQATRSWVAGIIKEKLKIFPNYKPKDIIIDIKEEYGIQLNYFQAWRGKEIAKEQLQGSYKDAYSQLPGFCEKIMESNPGSVATFTTKDDSSFHRLFVSFYASLYGFQRGCRPLLFLDSISLKSKYQGTLLAANAADGNDGVFPVAFAVVDSETDDNWRWFLLQLKSAMSTSGSITFVADREKGLKPSIAEIFENSVHSYCLRYLTENLFRDLKGQYSHEVKRLLVEDFYAAAYAPTRVGFDKYVENVKSISAEAYNWILQSEPEHWANAFFTAARFNHLTSNFGEMFYSWASEAHELPITQMVDVIRAKITELIYARRSESDLWLSRLTPSMEEKLEKANIKGQPLQVLLSGGCIFEVRGDTTEIVDIDSWDCSCKAWQLSGLPCRHAIAVIDCIGRSSCEYCSRYLTVECYRLTYAETLNPVPSLEIPSQNESFPTVVTVTPPPTRRPRGRPAKKRIGSQEIVKRQLQCSRCKGMGHNKSTCREVLTEP